MEKIKEGEVNFDYFYNRDVGRWSFIMLPKLLVTGNEFKSLSSDAKILYALLLERTNLSNKNGWIDKSDRVYIIFTIDDVINSLNKSNKTAVKILNELENIGLIERKRQGLGKPNIIYVKDFMSVQDKKCNNYTSEVKNLHSRNVETTLQEVKKVHGINTNYNNLNSNNTDYSILGKRKAFGTFGNVFLSDEDILELQNKMNYKLDNYIERLSSYIKSTGKTYKNHKATILSWYFKDEGNSNTKNTVYNITDYDKGEHL